MDWHPLRFRPLYQERVWGGHQLAARYRRDLPPDQRIGESWEVADRPGAQSIVADGPLAGRSLHELLTADPRGLLGDAEPRAGRFPLLIKILDAQQILSLQVHPPSARAHALGGESKTELWYFTATQPGAEILAGLRPGVTRDTFAQHLEASTVADCFHRLPVHPGDAMFLPSGRVHALGAGVVLFEIQENSDTTYRVYDWDRTGLDGLPRPLHIHEAMESIDFRDVEPSLIPGDWKPVTETEDIRPLVNDFAFAASAHRGKPGARWALELPRCAVVGVISGSLEIGPQDSGGPSVTLQAGDFVLLPAALGWTRLQAAEPTEWLWAQPSPAGARRPS